jgi:hypothetical protein
MASLMEKGIGVMVLVIVVGAVAIPVSDDVLVTETKSVTNETINSSGSTPDTFTVNNVEDGLKENSETVWFSDSFNGETFHPPSQNYTVDYSSGEFNFTEEDLDGDGDVDINSTDDQYNVSYNYKPDGYLGGTAGLVASYVPLALALAIFVGAISSVLM